PGLPVFYQWQRNNGSGYSDISGAYGATYSFNPSLADNGAKFRALISSPGSACITSSEGTLTVIQMNTAPKFDLGSVPGVNEDAGAQTVANVANNISPHSITRVPVAFSSAFNSLPPGMTLYGTAVVADGALKLTPITTGISGAAAVDTSAQNFESLDISWKSYIGDGVGGGADGYSLNIGDDLAGDPGYGGEEGKGNGLQVTVDTFNNAEL